MAQEKQKILFEMDDNIGDTIDRLSKMSDGLMETHDAMEEMADAGEGAMSTIQDALGTLDTKNLKAIEDVDFGKMIEGIDPGLRSLEDMNATLMQSASDYHDAKIKFEREGTDVARREAEQAKRIHEEKARAIMDTQKEMARTLDSQAREAKRVFVDQRQELHRYMEDEFPQKTGQEIGGAVKSALDADPAGMVMGVVSALKTGGEAAFKKASQALEERKMKKGVFPDMEDEISLEMEGPDMSEQAEGTGEMAEAAGAMKGMSGKMMKMAGAMMAAVGGIAMLVQLLMKAEQQTIELNEALFESTSLLDLGAGNVEDGVQNMRDLRDAATDFQTQIRLGMDPQEIMQATGALREQHIDLNELSEGYDDMGEAAVDTLQDIRFASLNLGASTGEVTEFVGNLHDVHSVAMDDIRTQLDVVVHSANQADMATEAFFSTVNQISGQMGLYNFRLEDTTALMSELSHLMDADTAQEFTEAMATGMKDMSAQDRMRTALLAGEHNVREMLTEESGRQLDTILESTGQQEELNEAFTRLGNEYGPINNAEELREQLQKAQDAGDFSELYADLNASNQELATTVQGAANMAEDAEAPLMQMVDSMGDLGAVDQMELRMRELEALGKDITDLTSIEADALGVDEERLRIMQRIEHNSGGQLNAIHELENEFQAGMEAPELEKRVEDLNERFGLQLDKQDIIEGKVENRHDLMRRLGEDQVNEIEDEKMTMEEAAREQVSATQSIGDVMEAIIADLLQEISGGVSFIADLIMQAPFINGRDFDFRQKMHNEQTKIAEERRQLEQQNVDLQREIKDAQESGDQDLAKELQDQKSAIDRQIDSLGQQESASGMAATLVEREFDIETVERARQQADEIGLDFAQHGDLLADQVRQLDRRGFHAGEDVMWDEDWIAEGSDMDKFRQDMESMRDRDIRSDMADALDEQNFEELNPDEQEKLLDDIAKQTAEDTVLDDRSSRDLADDIVESQERAKARQELQDLFAEAGVEDRDRLAHSIAFGQIDDDTQARIADLDSGTRQRAKKTLQQRGLSMSEDASILTGGFAPHLFAPGDMIVKADEIAQTRTGRAGEFAPDLLSQMGTGSGSGGGRPINMNTTINVSGGSADQVENAVLRAYDMIKRREMGES